MEIKEGLYQVFTDNPVNWIKWIVVFAILIAGYVVCLPIYKKVSYFFSYERKREMAKEKGHEIKATLISKHKVGDAPYYDYRVKYKYIVDEKEKKYKAFFKHPSSPPTNLCLYYINNPYFLFSCEEYRWQGHKGIVLLFINILPWIFALFAFQVLNIDISGF
ncbi:MAG: hypothetical protein R3Y40_08125 [Eubacteriales bacterium]